MQGRGSGRVRDFALYGETTGETDEFGLPVRYNWAAEYRGAAMVVYGHTPVPEPEWLNRTINIDTGCVFGGRLTALRYPERELVSVPARAHLLRAGAAVPARPSRAPALTAQQRARRRCSTSRTSLGKRHRRDAAARARVTIREENADRRAGGDEPLRRRPAWLDLPAADDVAVARRRRAPGLLEHPAEAFAYYRDAGRRRRSSARRSTWARGRSSSSAATRTPRGGASASTDGGVGHRATRAPAGASSTTRRSEPALLDRVRAALERGRLCGRARDRLGLPRLRADALVGEGAGAAPRSSTRRSARRRAPALAAAVAALERGRRARRRRRRRCSTRYRGARRARRAATSRRTAATAGRSQSLDDLRLAPFHLLATEGARPRRPRPRLAHGDARASSAAAGRRLLLRDRRTASSTSTDPASRGRGRRAGGRS